MGIDKIILLPVYVQLMLGCGYLGYLIARQGFRRNEQVADQILGVIAFGLPALPVWFLVLDLTGSIAFAGVAAVVFCALFALLWRVWLMDIWFTFTHRRQISNEDGLGNIWDTLIQDTELCPSQITVFLKNGERLFCDNTRLFENSAIGAPMLFDSETHEWLNGEWVAIDEVQAGDWGDRLTYIPKPEVLKVSVRYFNLGKRRALV